MGQFHTILLIISAYEALSSARPFSFCAPKSFDHFSFLTTFVPMLWITSSNFHVRPRISKLETVAENAEACAAHELIIG